MNAESRLLPILRRLAPQLDTIAYVFGTVTPADWQRLHSHAIAMMVEPEGISVILPESAARLEGWLDRPRWAKISLTLATALDEIGLIAVLSRHLAQANISVNPVAGHYHDHFFVPWETRQDALRILTQWSDQDSDNSSPGKGSAPGAGVP